MPTRYVLLAVTLSAASCVPAVAQSTQSYSAFVTGAGYVETPPFFPVAPGQVTTFFVSGLPVDGFANVVAAVAVNGTPQAVTVLSARPISYGAAAITVQIPFTVVPGLPTPSGSAIPAYSIQFGENDNPAGGPCGENTCTPPIALQAVFTNPHIITTCDIFYSSVPTNAGTVCHDAVTHQNGQLVTGTAPATPGEIVTIWALGLGVPVGGIPTNATGPIAMNDITVQAYFASTVPIPTIAAGTTPYEFAGMPSPTVGLYQINFAIPQPPMGTPACIAPTSGLVNEAAGNLNLTLGRNSGTAVVTGGSGFAFLTFGVGLEQSICVAT